MLQSLGYLLKVKVLVAQACLAVPLHGLYIAHQTSLSMEFSRQEYWSGLPFPSLWDLPDPEIKPGTPALQIHSFPSKPPGKPRVLTIRTQIDYNFQSERRKNWNERS